MTEQRGFRTPADLGTTNGAAVRLVQQLAVACASGQTGAITISKRRKVCAT
jgi:hypothetical protein